MGLQIVASVILLALHAHTALVAGKPMFDKYNSQKSNLKKNVEIG
jgi:hypothetical protein